MKFSITRLLVIVLLFPVIAELKIDKQTAAETYNVVQTSFNDTGVPTQEGSANIIRAVKADGRFTDRKVAYEDVVEPRFADRGRERVGIQGSITKTDWSGRVME